MKRITKNILIILILFISIAGVVLPKELNNLDEMWNYNFARCIADGLLPYKDFNMVQTPLLPILCGIILKISFNEMIVMRLLAIILITACFFVTYKILERLKINKYVINVFIICTYLLLYNYFCIDYNYAVLLIILTTIYIELKYEIYNVNFKRDFWLGFLVGTSILFKQTTGLVLTAVFILYKTLLISHKNDFKTAFRIIIYRIIGTLIPITLLVIYLSLNNIWEDFLDYTVYSINTFSNKIPYMILMIGKYGFTMQILSFIIPITILIMYYISICKPNKTKEQKNIFILFCYSVASMAVVYPISDRIHFLIGALPCLIALCYLLYLLISKILKTNKTRLELKYFIKTFGFLSIVVIFAFSAFNTFKYLKTANYFTKLKHFKYIPVFNESIYEIDNFIMQVENKGYKVYILDATAANYMIPLDKYNKNYDMFLKGNLGSNGEEKIIEKLDNENENTILFVKNDNYKKNWQTPEDIIKYVKDKWSKQGSIYKFDIYCKRRLFWTN